MRGVVEEEGSGIGSRQGVDWTAYADADLVAALGELGVREDEVRSGDVEIVLDAVGVSRDQVERRRVHSRVEG